MRGSGGPLFRLGDSLLPFGFLFDLMVELVGLDRSFFVGYAKVRVLGLNRFDYVNELICCLGGAYIRILPGDRDEGDT